MRFSEFGPEPGMQLHSSVKKVSQWAVHSNNIMDYPSAWLSVNLEKVPSSGGAVLHRRVKVSC